jgi:sulfur transfer ThiS family protein
MTGDVTFRVASHLDSLLPERDHSSSHTATGISLDAGSWNDLVRQLQERLPQLAQRALTPSGGIADGFVLVVNDEVLRRPDASLVVRPGDQICLLAALAGG